MKPILFNTEMVQAILDGKKTVTRRICKDANEYTVPLNGYVDDEKRTYAIQSFCDIEHTNSVSIAEVKMPICAGDILYIRETWHVYTKRVGNGENCKLKEFYGYRASVKNSEDAEEKWKPSIHMPKDAARIFLKVTNVRVERLQDMNGLDVLKEGVNSLVHPNADYFNGNQLDMFERLWNSTLQKPNNKFKRNTNSWADNPWVWVIEFERCEKPVDE